jgi:hypothetical protein
VGSLGALDWGRRLMSILKKLAEDPLTCLFLLTLGILFTIAKGTAGLFAWIFLGFGLVSAIAYFARQLPLLKKLPRRY